MAKSLKILKIRRFVHIYNIIQQGIYMGGGEHVYPQGSLSQGETSWPECDTDNIE